MTPPSPSSTAPIQADPSASEAPKTPKTRKIEAVVDAEIVETSPTQDRLGDSAKTRTVDAEIVETSPTQDQLGDSAETPEQRRDSKAANMQLDYNKVATRLYQGSFPDPAHDYAQFTMIVLCAEEHAPALPRFGGKVIRTGFNDTDKPTTQDLTMAATAAGLVYRELIRGGRVLVTCAAGRNRSGLVVGLVLRKRFSPAETISAIRAARGEQALNNPTFYRLVWEVAAGKPPASKPRTPTATNGGAPEKKRGILGTIFQSAPKGASPDRARGNYGRARARAARGRP